MSGHDGGVDPPPAGGRATILHADLDAFYASVEQRDDPDLQGKPVVVGTGVVLAASYEARVVGVRSGMNGADRRRRCPNAIVIKPRMKVYTAASRLVMACFDDVTPLVEPLSVDEAFLDVSGAQRLLGSPREIARRLRARVADEVGLPLSVGIASTKFLAKVASAAAKPDGLIEVPAGGELDFLHPRPVECLWGVGPVTSRKLREAGFATVGQIAALDRETLAGVVGAGAGHHLHALAHNRDPRVVDTQRGRRSISAQRALGNRNDRSLDEIQAIVLGLVDRVAQRLRAKDWVARTVTVRFRFADMTRATRSHTLATPAATTAALHEVADQLTVDLLGTRAEEDGRTELSRRGLTLIGVAFSGLGPSDAVQLTLPGTADEPLATQADRQDLDSAVDAVRERFGHDLVKPAALLGQGPALEMPRLPD